MKKGFSIVEMLIVMLLMSVMLVVMLPVLTIKKKSVFAAGSTPVDSRTDAGRCIIDENALSIEYDTDGKLLTLQRLMSPDCSGAVENMKSTGSDDYNAAKNLAYNGETEPANQQIAARKLMRAACENGSDDACGWFAESCDVASGNCDLDDVDQNKYLDLKFYLDLLASDTRTTRVLAQGSDRYKTANNVYANTSSLQTYLHSQCSSAIAANSTTGYNTMACQMVKQACSIGGIRACYHHVKDQCVDNGRCTHLKDFIAITASDNSQAGRAIVRNMLVAEDVYLEDGNFTWLFDETNLQTSIKSICTLPSNTACEMIKWECDNDLHQEACLHIITPLCATTNQCSVLQTYLDMVSPTTVAKPEAVIRDLMKDNFTGNTVTTTTARCNANTSNSTGVWKNNVVACDALQRLCKDRNNSSACTYFTGKCGTDNVCDTDPSNNTQYYAKYDFNFFASYAYSSIASISTFINDAIAKYLANNTNVKTFIDNMCSNVLCTGDENASCNIKYNGGGCKPLAAQAVEKCNASAADLACTTAFTNGWNTSCKKIKDSYTTPYGHYPYPTAGTVFRLTTIGTSDMYTYACDLTQTTPTTPVIDWTTTGSKSVTLSAGTYKFEAWGAAGGNGGNGGIAGQTSTYGSSGSDYNCGGFGGGGGGGGASGIAVGGSNVIIAGGGGGSGGGGGACVTPYYANSMGGGGGGGGSKGIYVYGEKTVAANSSLTAYIGVKGGDGGNGTSIYNTSSNGTGGNAGSGGAGFGSCTGGNGSGIGGNSYCTYGANGGGYCGGGGSHGGGGYNTSYSRCSGYGGGSGGSGSAGGNAYSTSYTNASSSGGGAGYGGGGAAAGGSVWNGGGSSPGWCSNAYAGTGNGGGGGSYNNCNTSVYSGGSGAGKGGTGGGACYSCGSSYGYTYGYATGGTGGTSDKGGNGGNGYGPNSCWGSCQYYGWGAGGGGGGYTQGGGGGGAYSYSGNYAGGGGGGGAGGYYNTGLSNTSYTYDSATAANSGNGRIKITLLD